MSDSDGFVPGIILGALFSAFLSCAITGACLQERWRAMCVGAGVAHWTIDAKTGETAFEFIKPAPAPAVPLEKTP